MTTHIKHSHFGIQRTNKRNYSTAETQRLVQKIAELSNKTINKELPLKKSANSAFSSLPPRKQPERPIQQQQRQLGRASLDLSSQYNSFYYNNNSNANCIQVSRITKKMFNSPFFRCPTIAEESGQQTF